MEHLKKCPFCGGVPLLAGNPGSSQMYVCCKDCGAAYSVKAIAAWNRRPSPWQPVTATAPAHDIDVLTAYYSNEDKQYYTVKARRRVADTPTFDADDGRQYVSPPLWAECAQAPEKEET